MSQTMGRSDHVAQERTSGWAIGWTVFAGVLMVVQGAWWIMAGIVALVNDEFYVLTQEYVFQFDISTWGWIHVIFGAVILAAGIGLFTATTWARVVGVTVASLGMLIAFAWLPWYPIWAIMFIVASISVIWALTAHGEAVAALDL